MDRTGDGSLIATDETLTAIGLVSRLEHALDHFDAELAEHRRSVVENTRRVADYEPRVGGAFPLAGELAVKLAAMAELEESLAQTAEQDEDDMDDGSINGLGAPAAERVLRRGGGGG